MVQSVEHTTVQIVMVNFFREKNILQLELFILNSKSLFKEVQLYHHP